MSKKKKVNFDLYFVFKDGLPVRLKEVHVLNAGSLVTMLFNIIKPFMRSNLMSLVSIQVVF